MCDSMFPKSTNANVVKRAERIREVVTLLNSSRDVHIIGMLRRELQSLTAVKDDLIGGLRIDVYIKCIDGNELFIDVTGLCICFHKRHEEADQ